MTPGISVVFTPTSVLWWHFESPGILEARSNNAWKFWINSLPSVCGNDYVLLGKI